MKFEKIENEAAEFQVAKYQYLDVDRCYFRYGCEVEMPHRLKGLKTERGGFQSKDSKPSLEKFVDKRDYVGALTFLNYSSPNEVETLLWKAYCLFHSNDFESAQKIYIDILSGNYKSGDPPEEIGLYLGCVYYFLEMYSEAAEAAIDGPECALKNRLMYHLSLKMEESNEQILMYRQRLMEGEEDQLSRAAMLYTHCNFQEACEIYKRLLTEDRGRVALNLYVAMCYFKLVSSLLPSSFLVRYCRTNKIAQV